MSADTPFPYLVRMRSIIARTVDFLKIAPQIRHRRDYEQREKSMAAELEQALSLECVAQEDFGALAALIVTAPGVIDAFCIKTCALDQHLGTKDGGDKKPKVHAIREEYRVFIRTDEKHAEVTDFSLCEAGRKAFDAVGLNLPAGYPAQKQTIKTPC